MNLLFSSLYLLADCLSALHCDKCFLYIHLFLHCIEIEAKTHLMAINFSSNIFVTFDCLRFECNLFSEHPSGSLILMMNRDCEFYFL